jgi:hypothetical protein
VKKIKLVFKNELTDDGVQMGPLFLETRVGLKPFFRVDPMDGLAKWCSLPYAQDIARATKRTLEVI